MSCPWCDMEMEPQKLKNLNTNITNDKVALTSLYRCEVCGKTYKQIELYDYVKSEIQYENGMLMELPQ